MQALLVFCVCLGALSVEGEILNELNSLLTFIPEMDVSSSQHQPVDSSSASSEFISNYNFESSDRVCSLRNGQTSSLRIVNIVCYTLFLLKVLLNYDKVLN